MATRRESAGGGEVVAVRRSQARWFYRVDVLSLGSLTLRRLQVKPDTFTYRPSRDACYGPEVNW